jgi:hypothetical protein
MIQPELTDDSKMYKEEDFDDMHFATFLLGEDGPKPEYAFFCGAVSHQLIDHSARRLETQLTLIDFDMSEYRTSSVKGGTRMRTVRGKV